MARSQVASDLNADLNPPIGGNNIKPAQRVPKRAYTEDAAEESGSGKERAPKRRLVAVPRSSG